MDRSGPGAQVATAVCAGAACAALAFLAGWKLAPKPAGEASASRTALERSPKASVKLTGKFLEFQHAKEDFQPRQSVTVQSPATSANLGSGYDCLGLALDMWNEVTVERAPKFSIVVHGEGTDDIPLDDSNLVVVGLKAAFEAVGERMPTMKITITNRIPHGRGLGSSSAAIAGGLVAGLALAGKRLNVSDHEEVLQLAATIEGHPDNVAPALYGGVQLGIWSSSEVRWMTQRIQIPHGLIFVMFIPAFVGKTEELRKVVPKKIPIEDAVYNMGRVAWLVSALLSGDTKGLRDGVDDKLHQRARGDAVYKHLFPLMDAAYGAGAAACYLSGAGPSVMAITTGGLGDFFTQKDDKFRKDHLVAAAMRECADALGVEGQVYITHPAHTGAVVISADPPYSTPLLAYNGDT